VWDAHCLDCAWQGWTAYGQEAIEMMADRHLHAAKVASLEPATSRSVMDIMRDLRGMPA